jgi:hypothetical protein
MKYLYIHNYYIYIYFNHNHLQIILRILTNNFIDIYYLFPILLSLINNFIFKNKKKLKTYISKIYIYISIFKLPFLLKNIFFSPIA